MTPARIPTDFAPDEDLAHVTVADRKTVVFTENAAGDVPARGNVVIRVPFTDVTGRTVLHCHILNHEDMGMMAILDIVPPRPRGK